jgi:hypothetical protein
MEVGVGLGFCGIRFYGLSGQNYADNMDACSRSLTPLPWNWSSRKETVLEKWMRKARTLRSVGLPAFLRISVLGRIHVCSRLTMGAEAGGVQEVLSAWLELEGSRQALADLKRIEN